MSLLSSVPRQRSVAGGARGGKSTRGTSPIESHFGARLIYFFRLLVRMQMTTRRAAPLRRTFSRSVPARVLARVSPRNVRFPSRPRESIPTPLFPSRISIPLICLALIVREA